MRRDPRPDPAQPSGHGYASLTVLAPSDTISPLAAPALSFAVADLVS